MLDSLILELPEAEIIVQSVLPISSDKEASACHNSTIITFNKSIEQEVQKRGLSYVDINSLYQQNGTMNPELTTDGVHLYPEAYDLWADAIQNYIE